jgi:hypothetical protein
MKSRLGLTSSTHSLLAQPHNAGLPNSISFYSRHLKKIIADIALDVSMTRALDNSAHRHSDLDFALNIPHVRKHQGLHVSTIC